MKKNQKQDPKLIAMTENEGSEAKYVAKQYKIPIKVVRETMYEVGKNGKPGRSRKMIYAALRVKGYVIEVKKKKASTI